MAKNRVIIDCYTDEPAGLGVPPFIGTWPRYLSGSYRDLPLYLTIDDLRLLSRKENLVLNPKSGKTKIGLINHTRNRNQVRQIIKKADQLIFNLGIQTPGKYLAAKPASLKEVLKLTEKIKTSKIIVGPISHSGSQRIGGKRAEMASLKDFNSIKKYNFPNYEQLQNDILKGNSILNQIPQKRIIEIETGRGCYRKKGCSFCTEPLKGKVEWRCADHIVEEINELIKMGRKYIRLGKQSCIYSYGDGDYNQLEYLIKSISAQQPEVFHIDNANPAMVTAPKTKLLAQYLTPGSTAAMGAESFDPAVIKQNNLNSTPEKCLKAIEIINQYGKKRGDNGCHYLLPGINILLGLEGETKTTLRKNYEFLKSVIDKGYLLRRINIRKVVPFPGTDLNKRCGNKYLKKNKKYYRNFIKAVREDIDQPMLKLLFPKGIVLKNLFAEIHDKNTTFLRHFGSYPIVVGVKKRIPLNQFYNVEITDHMLRSLVGKVI